MANDLHQAKLGDSVRLDCNATGDQPLQIDWFREGTNSSLEKHGNDLYDIHELPSSAGGEFGLSSYMQIRQLKSDDSLLYKCLARNEFGSGERLIKLIVLGVPERPTDLRVRDVWSRSALVSWRPPQTLAAAAAAAAATQQQQPSNGGGGATTTTTGRISNYTVQYWRKNPAAAAAQVNQLALGQAAKQNHRREDLLVDGLHNSALLVNLLPAITYEVSVIAHNQVGQSEPSEPVNVTTSEEEPSAPPTDVQVEARGSATLRVMWKVPPAESLNGRLLGFYVGYRPRAFFAHPSASSNSLVLGHHHPSGAGQQAAIQQQQQQQQTGAGPSQQQLLQSVIYSFKTSDAIEGQLFYETFLTNLKHSQEYEIIVRAFNKAGSGPDCHVIAARTSSARLPQAPNLQVQRVTTNSVTLKWTATVLVGGASPAHHSLHGRPGQTSPAQSVLAGMVSMGQPALEVLRYVLYYQIQGERDWYELTVGRSPQEDQLQQQQQQQQLESPAGLMPADELVGGAGGGGGGQSELITSQSSVHTLSNLQPGYTYRVYVAAANDYGIGDPSNVISLRTDPTANNHTASAAFGAALLDDSQTGGGGGSLSPTGGLFDAWPAGKQQGLLYTTLSFGALIVLLVMLTVYLIWQRKFRNKYNSSSASSYPSSWTPAASDTIQSEYSVKRFPNNPMIGSAGQAASSAGGGGELFGSAAAAAAVADHATDRRFAGSTHRAAANQQQQQQLLRNMGAGGGQSSTTSRPVPLSSHYHQPADLISNTSTLQLHPALHPSGQAAQFRHQKASATLNRNQNRQLPPIPYSTMSVKEMDNSKQWRLQQPDGNYRHCQQSLLRPSKQQQQQQQANHHQYKQQQQMASSQTPLIYGVIE